VQTGVLHFFAQVQDLGVRTLPGFARQFTRSIGLPNKRPLSPEMWGKSIYFA
jgi:hypothetical protein